MDLTMVDLTAIEEVQVGDEVVLWGEQRGARIGLEEVAAWAQTIPYDLLCSMGKRVVRVFLREGAPPKVLTLVGERREVEVAETGGGAGRKRRRKVEYKSDQPTHDLEKIVDRVESGEPVCLVWVEYSVDDEYWSVEELSEHLRLVELDSADDVTTYRLEPR